MRRPFSRSATSSTRPRESLPVLRWRRRDAMSPRRHRRGLASMPCRLDAVDAICKFRDAVGATRAHLRAGPERRQDPGPALRHEVHGREHQDAALRPPHDHDGPGPRRVLYAASRRGDDVVTVTRRSHIKGLLINCLHHFWPSLLEIPGFLRCFITPIVKATSNSKKGPSKTFFTVLIRRPSTLTPSPRRMSNAGSRVRGLEGLHWEQRVEV